MSSKPGVRLFRKYVYQQLGLFEQILHNFKTLAKRQALDVNL